METKYTFLLLFIVTGFACAYKQCAMPGGNAGECRPLKQCKPLAELNKKRVKTDEELLYIKQSTCGVTSSFLVLVCCPPEQLWDSFKNFKPVRFNEIITYETIVREKDNDVSDKILGPNDDSINKTVVPNDPTDFVDAIDVSQGPNDNQKRLESMCGKYDDSADKIIGGSYAEYNEYPWLVLLEYEMNQTLCGGSLITPRYVLTAAHCIKRSSNAEPKFARLSEYNTTTFPTDFIEVNGGGFVNLTVKRIPIEKNIAHPNYTRMYVHHDVGLSKLTIEAKLGDYIRLICLPNQDYMKSFAVPLNLTVAGWGSDGVRPSDVKKYVRVPFVDMETCKAIYTGNRIIDGQMCAGGNVDEDSCSGDSGGPLMYEINNTFVVVGIVSYGSRQCGVGGVPGVYTYVHSYLDWIRDNME